MCVDLLTCTYVSIQEFSSVYSFYPPSPTWSFCTLLYFLATIHMYFIGICAVCFYSETLLCVFSNLPKTGHFVLLFYWMHISTQELQLVISLFCLFTCFVHVCFSFHLLLVFLLHFPIVFLFEYIWPPSQTCHFIVFVFLWMSKGFGIFSQT